MNIDPYLTPYKREIPILTGSGIPGAFDEQAVDCPFVFRHNDKYCMMYIGFDGIGYQTGLATSDDLLTWNPLGTILRRGEGNGWDSLNIAGTWMLRDNDLNGPGTLKKYDNKYWLAYHSYPSEGYESGPGRIGLAWTEDPELLVWNRLPEPILIPEDGGEWEQAGLYKECLVEHDGVFYLFYNAKDKHHYEQTGVATSTDLIHWTRHANNPVLRNTPGAFDSFLASDPCVLKHGDHWVMFYFGCDRMIAQDGIARSSDLIHWEKYPEPIVRTGPDGSIDSVYAHKPSVFCRDGVLYHFYCACRPSRPDDIAKCFDMFRTITVATSSQMP